MAQHHVYESFYVDDLLAGASTPEDALQLQQHLRALLLKGGFDLRKWLSNSSQVLSAIPTELHEQSQTKTLSQDSTSHSKALGMHKRLILCCYRCSHYSSCHQKIHHFRHSKVFLCAGKAGSGHHSNEGAAPAFVGDQGRLG